MTISSVVHVRSSIAIGAREFEEPAFGLEEKVACFTFMGGLDDGPWLPGCAPRKRPRRKTPAELREIRLKAWVTRRHKLGPKGHR